MMITKQTIIRFAHPCGQRSSSEWRQALLASHGDALQHVAISQSSSALNLIALKPEASETLREKAIDLMRAVAGIAGQVLSVEMPELTPALSRTGYRWLYEVPRLVMARSGEDWQPWREDHLEQALAKRVRERIETDLGTHLRAWGVLADDLGIELVSDGAPMVLKNAVANGPKPVSAMSRKNIIFSSSARIEGAFFVGRLQATGHGRVFRSGYEETAKEAA